MFFRGVPLSWVFLMAVAALLGAARYLQSQDHGDGITTTVTMFRKLNVTEPAVRNMWTVRSSSPAALETKSVSGPAYARRCAARFIYETMPNEGNPLDPAKPTDRALAVVKLKQMRLKLEQSFRKKVWKIRLLKDAPTRRQAARALTAAILNNTPQRLALAGDSEFVKHYAAAHTMMLAIALDASAGDKTRKMQSLSRAVAEKVW